jgi:hypothetical protein
MIDFPDSPALNQSFSVSGKTWKWNGTAWLADSEYTLAPVALSGDYNDLLNKPGSGGAATINDLDEMFTSARATYYHEVNYTAGGDVSAIEVYATSAKATHLYSRAFTYNASGNITQVLTTDRQNSGVSLTKTISYNGSGDIATVTRNYNI